MQDSTALISRVRIAGGMSRLPLSAPGVVPAGLPEGGGGAVFIDSVVSISASVFANLSAEVGSTPSNELRISSVINPLHRNITAACFQHPFRSPIAVASPAACTVRSQTHAGALALARSNADIDGVLFELCTATLRGGALFATASQVRMDNCTLVRSADTVSLGARVS